MIRTRVGYSGGTTPDPTYHYLSDHSESVQVDFDPSLVSYRDLLGVFWDLHRPTHATGLRQYMSAIFYHDENQHRLALAVRDALQAEIEVTIHTQILPAGRFYLAENYHQKYYLRHTPELMAEFERIYPQAQDFIDSTAAARINGFIAGHGNQAILWREIDQYGLSERGRERLLAMVKNRLRIRG